MEECKLNESKIYKIVNNINHQSLNIRLSGHKRKRENIKFYSKKCVNY